MKAGLMRVNYDPRYTSPHTPSLQNRLAVTRDIYGAGAGCSQRHLKDTLEEAAARRKARQRLLASLSPGSPEKDRDGDSTVSSQHSRHHSKKEESSDNALDFLQPNEPWDKALDCVPQGLMLPSSKGCGEDESTRRRRRDDREGEGRGAKERTRLDQHKEGVAAAHCSLRPLHHGNTKATTPTEDKNSASSTNATTSSSSYRIPSSYGERLLKRQQSVNSFNSPSKHRYGSKQVGLSHDAALHLYHRSRTVGNFGEILTKKNPAMAELEKRARRQADKAIKDRKVFTIMGPYHSLRMALRRRGWVEKFNNAPPPGEVTNKRRPVNSDSDDDDGNDRHHAKENITPPWEEENGFYGMMSHLARNCTPSLIFAVKTVDVECRRGGQLVNHFGKARHFTTKSEAVQTVRPTLIFAVRSLDVESRSRHQIVNHYARANNFTTKMGLCQNLRAVPWYETADPDEFYPRCFKLDDDEERQAFVEDYRITACVSFLKWFVEKYEGITVEDEQEEKEKEKKSLNAIVTSMMSTTQALGNAPSDSLLESIVSTSPRSLDQQLAEPEPALSSSSPRPASGPSRTTLPAATPLVTPAPSTASVIASNLSETSATTSGPILPASSAMHAACAPSSEPSSNRRPEVARSGTGGSHAKGSLLPVLPSRGLSASSAATTAASMTSTSPPASPTGSVMGRFLYHRSGKTMKSKHYHMAIRQCESFLKMKEHEDIDVLSDPNALSDAQWEQFLSCYYTFVHEDADFMKVTGAMVRHCKELLEKLREHLPQYYLDGCRNVWIIKPGAKSRGRGIQCQDRLDKILAMTTDADDKFVAQKYIERPFLVHQTKFDIRQWFLVTDWQPLTIWFYESCYLRFCSQIFTLDNFHESIHLSNNSVQKNYSNMASRSEKLPSDNMWTDTEFQEYLKNNSHGDVWHERVVPGMKSALTCSMLCTQELVEVRKSAFELYGADFMLTEDFQPWLIEINSSPSMSRNTRVTCQLVDAVLEDTLKVVLDRRADKNADTGGFKCIFRQSPVSDPRPMDMDLTVTGRKIRKRHFNYTPHRGPVNHSQR